MAIHPDDAERWSRRLRGIAKDPRRVRYEQDQELLFEVMEALEGILQETADNGQFGVGA